MAGRRTFGRGARRPDGRGTVSHPIRRPDGRGARLLESALRLLPGPRRELGEALLAEASVVAPGWRRFAWIAGGFLFVARESAMRVVGYGLGLAVAVALVATLDRIGTSDDSGQVVLLVLLVCAAALGFIAPRWAWLAGLVVGSAVAVTAMATAAWGPAPTGKTSIHTVGDAATLFVLIVPALISAYLGAGAAWLRRRSRD